MAMIDGAAQQAVVTRNSVVYRCATPDPAQALLLGTGAAGASVHTPDDSLYLLFGRCDVWNGDNTMSSLGAVRVRGSQGLFSGATSVRQECDLLEARLRIEVRSPEGAVFFDITGLRDRDLFVIEILDERRIRSSFTVFLENWHEDESVETLGEDGLASTHLTTQSNFDAMNRRVNVDARQHGITDPLLHRAWGLFLKAPGACPSGAVSDGVAALELASGASHRVCIAALCIAPDNARSASDEERTPLEALRARAALLLQASPEQLAKWRAEHARWWGTFWSRSTLALCSGSGDAEYEERLWHIAQYSIAAGSGGPLPLRFNGGPWLLEKDARTWNWGYWFQNMREIYWPLFAAGHADLARGFFDLYRNAKTFVRAQTRSLFDLDGLCFREVQTLWGLDTGTNFESGSTNSLTHLYFSGNLELCLLMEWYVRATGDEEFLRGELVPCLKEVIAFYRGYARRDENGVFHFEPVNALETWTGVRDAQPDLCGLHHFLPRLIEWGQRFNAPPEEIADWREFLEFLPPLPVGFWRVLRGFEEGIHDRMVLQEACLSPDGTFLPAAGPSQRAHEDPSIDEQKSPWQPVRFNMENAELYPLFPWGAVGLGSPSTDLRRALNTWRHRTWTQLNNGWAQDVMQLARLGEAEAAGAASLEHASYSQRFPNGCFISPAEPLFHGLLTDTPYFDAAGVHAAGITEMLLQSHDGIIRLCPATPSHWSGAFRLHAFDGFEVEALFEHGKPVRALITARRAGVLRLCNSRNVVMQVGERPTEPGAVAEFSMQPGEALEAFWPAKLHSGESASRGVDEICHERRPEVVWAGYKIQPPPVPRADGHWHDERKGHGQIGLAEDGLFPATRSLQTAPR